MYAEGKSMGDIAKALGRSKSSISREIARNKNKDGTYQPWRATILYICRRKKCLRHRRLEGGEIRAFVEEKLDKAWPPEAIAARWKQAHEDDTLSHTTIYRALKKEQLSERFSAKTHLRRHGKRKNSHNSKTIHAEHTIQERPEIIEKRVRLGDLEGDTVYGGIKKGCAVTLVDRTSRILYGALADSRESKVINASFKKALGETAV